MELKEAVHKAIEVLSPGEIKDYLSLNEAEVGDMSYLTEYDEEKTRELFKQEYIQEGIEQGIEQGIELANALNKKLLAEKRFDELERCANEPDYQKQLIEEMKASGEIK